MSPHEILARLDALQLHHNVTLKAVAGRAGLPLTTAHAMVQRLCGAASHERWEQLAKAIQEYESRILDSPTP